MQVGLEVLQSQAHYQTPLIADQFVTVYNHVQIINQITNEIIYFAMSIEKQVKECFFKNINAFLSPTKNPLGNK